MTALLIEETEHSNPTTPVQVRVCGAGGRSLLAVARAHIEKSLAREPIDFLERSRQRDGE